MLSLGLSIRTTIDDHFQLQQQCGLSCSIEFYCNHYTTPLPAIAMSKQGSIFYTVELQLIQTSMIQIFQ